jgi:hypothetical protein
MTLQQALYQAQQQLETVNYSLAHAFYQIGGSVHQALLRDQARLINLIYDLQKQIAAGGGGNVPPGYQPPPSGGGKPDPLDTSENDSAATAWMWGSAALILIGLFVAFKPSRR